MFLKKNPVLNKSRAISVIYESHSTLKLKSKKSVNRETEGGGKYQRHRRESNRETSKRCGERPRKKRQEEGRERVVFYHPRDSSFSQIRDRKQDATGNCFT